MCGPLQRLCLAFKEAVEPASARAMCYPLVEYFERMGVNRAICIAPKDGLYTYVFGRLQEFTKYSNPFGYFLCGELAGGAVAFSFAACAACRDKEYKQAAAASLTALFLAAVSYASLTRISVGRLENDPTAGPYLNFS